MANEIVISEAPDVEEIARGLIRDYHPHLLDARIRYLRSTQDRKSKGKSVAAHMGKFSPMDRFLASGTAADVEEGEEYYLIVYDAFSDYDERERVAAIDHECSHLVQVEIDEDGTPILGFVGHDVEEFAAVIQRHGLWNREIREFTVKARQLSLDGLMRPAAERVGATP